MTHTYTTSQVLLYCKSVTCIELFSNEIYFNVKIKKYHLEISSITENISLQWIGNGITEFAKS